MPGKCRPSLREKTLANVMRSNLSETDKACIKAVFERYVDVVRCKDCKYYTYERGCPLRESGYFCDGKMLPRENDFCSYGERRADNATD